MRHFPYRYMIVDSDMQRGIGTGQERFYVLLCTRRHMEDCRFTVCGRRSEQGRTVLPMKYSAKEKGIVYHGDAVKRLGAGS